MSDSAVRQRLEAAGVQKLRFDLEVYEEAQRLYNRHPRPGWRAMADELGRDREDAPSESALRAWASKGVITEDDEDAPWQLGEMSPEDEALLLPFLWDEVVTAIHFDHQPPRVVLPLRSARWIVRLRRMAPELDPEASQDHKWVLLLMADAASLGERRLVEHLLVLKGWTEHGKEWVRDGVRVGALPAKALRIVDRETYDAWLRKERGDGR